MYTCPDCGSEMYFMKTNCIPSTTTAHCRGCEATFDQKPEGLRNVSLPPSFVRREAEQAAAGTIAKGFDSIEAEQAAKVEAHLVKTMKGFGLTHDQEQEVRRWLKSGAEHWLVHGNTIQADSFIRWHKEGGVVLFLLNNTFNGRTVPDGVYFLPCEGSFWGLDTVKIAGYRNNQPPATPTLHPDTGPRLLTPREAAAIDAQAIHNRYPAD